MSLNDMAGKAFAFFVVAICKELGVQPVNIVRPNIQTDLIGNELHVSFWVPLLSGSKGTDENPD